MDAAAKAKAGSDVTATYNGQTVVVSDETQIPANLRGYVQIAIDRGKIARYGEEIVARGFPAISSRRLSP